MTTSCSARSATTLLNGGKGNDVYYVASATVKLSEAAGQGTVTLTTFVNATVRIDAFEA